jgi:hypothetical protein
VLLQEIRQSAKQCEVDDLQEAIRQSNLEARSQRQAAVELNRAEQKVMEVSLQEAVEKEALYSEHVRRLNERLGSNNMTMIDIERNGDCFFESVYMLLTKKLLEEIDNSEILRQEVIGEIFSNEELYSGFNTAFNIQEMMLPGNWNSDMGDLFPVATANLLNCQVQIFSSHPHQLAPISFNPAKASKTFPHVIRIGHIACPGQEHYNSCIPSENVYDLSIVNIDETNPVLLSISKPKGSPSKWKRNQRKVLRNNGQEYVNKSGRTVAKKRVSYANCSGCRFKCTAELSEKEQENICHQFWKLGSHEQRSLFVVSNVDEESTKSNACECSSGKKQTKEVTQQYFLPVIDKTKNVSTRKRVCKATFLRVLCIGAKTVSYNLQKHRNGESFQDKRGKKSSINKTHEEDVEFARQHILSFPRVPSHYCRKSTSKEYLPSDLNLPKMYSLYQDACRKEEIKTLLSIKAYRQQFRFYNFSFHRPKKTNAPNVSLTDIKITQKLLRK